MEIECHRKIIDLHIFIESWLKGAIERAKLEFQYFENALDKDFTIIHPDGKLQSKLEIIDVFWKAYGVHPDSFAIEIQNIKVRYLSNNICIMNYEEWQTGVEKTGRLSTVIFRKTVNSDKIYWLHLHETWLMN